MSRRMVSYSDLRSRWGIKHTKNQLRRRWQMGLFPAPIKDGQQNSWLEDEIEAHIDRLISERDETLAA